MDELDMSGVDPLRWEEIRRRVAVVKEYLDIPFPTKLDQKAHAARLDLKIHQFMALVRAWREHKSAARLAASGLHRGTSRRANRLSVDRTAKTVATDVICEMGPAASITAINRVVVERSVALGVRPPSQSTIWNMAMALRRDGDDGDGDRERGIVIVIGTCPVRLPMQGDEGVVLPELTMAVRPDGAIIAAALDHADWQTTALTIASMSDESVAVRVDKDLLTRKRSANVQAGVLPVIAAHVRSPLSRRLGRGIDRIELNYRPSRTLSPERLLTTKTDRPLSREDVRTIVVAAVTRHNAARGARNASWIDEATASKGA